MGDNMACSDFVLEDSQIAHDVKDARVSINVVSKNSPPTWPEHNADIIYSWCFSAMYHHKTGSQCFYYAKTINQILEGGKLSDEEVNHVRYLFQKVLDLQFRNANNKLVEKEGDWFKDKPLNMSKLVSNGLLNFQIPPNT